MNENLTEQDGQKIIDKLVVLQNDSLKVKYAFYNRLTPVILGFLGLMVSLKSADNSSKASQLFFFSTILLLGLCVLCSVIIQYSEFSYSKKYLESYKEESRKLVLGKSENKIAYVGAEISTFFSIVEKLTIVFLILSILSLIIYSYVLNFC